MSLSILNWNMSIINFNPKMAVEFIKSSSAKIISLQEVNAKVFSDLIDYAKASGFYYTSCAEMTKANGEPASSLLLISKLPVKSSSTFTYSTDKVNSLYLSFARKFFALHENNEAVYIDVVSNNKTLRIYNVHLTWATGPKRRVAQFNSFCEYLEPTINNIICGDLNVFGGLKYYNFMTSLVFGYRWDELMYDERKYFDNKFTELKLQNPFSGTISWPLIPFNAQLDHVLLPEDYEVLSLELSKSRYGSDHLPQFIEFQC